MTQKSHCHISSAVENLAHSLSTADTKAPTINVHAIKPYSPLNNLPAFFRSLAESSQTELRQVIDIFKDELESGAVGSGVKEISLQMAAVEEFGLPVSPYFSLTLEFAIENILRDQLHGSSATPLELGNLLAKNLDVSRNAQRGILRALYQTTQNNLNQMGLKGDEHLTIYRFVDVETANQQGLYEYRAGEQFDFVPNPLEVWYYDPMDIANEDYGYFVKICTSVPVRDILSISPFSFPCSAKSGLVVIGRSLQKEVILLDA